MRFTLILVLLGSVLLAACATPTPELPTLAASNTPNATLTAEAIIASSATVTPTVDVGPGEGTLSATDAVPPTLDEAMTPVEPTLDPVLVPTYTAIAQAVATSGGGGAPTIQAPIAGTLVIPPATEDPNPGAIFDTIIFVQSGGPENQTLTIVVFSDGRVLRDGEEFRISQELVTQIDTILDELNFFALQGVFTAPGGSGNHYLYEVTVARADASRTLQIQDNLMPPQLQELLSILLEAGLTRPGA